MPAALALLLSGFFSAQAPAAPGGAEPPILYRYEVIPERSRVSFSFRGLILPSDAHFGLARGEILLPAGDTIVGASGRLEVETASIRAGDPVQERMLRDQVLEAKRHPKAELRVSGARASGPPERRGRERDWEVEGQGVLLLHGVERRVSLRFQLADTGAELYLRGEGEIRLSDFDMQRPATLLLMPGRDAVRVGVRLVARPSPRPAR